MAWCPGIHNAINYKPSSVRNAAYALAPSKYRRLALAYFEAKQDRGVWQIKINEAQQNNARQCDKQPLCAKPVVCWRATAYADIVVLGNRDLSARLLLSLMASSALDR